MTDSSAAYLDDLFSLVLSRVGTVAGSAPRERPSGTSESAATTASSSATIPPAQPGAPRRLLRFGKAGVNTEGGQQPAAPTAAAPTPVMSLRSESVLHQYQSQQESVTANVAAAAPLAPVLDAFRRALMTAANSDADRGWFTGPYCHLRLGMIMIEGNPLQARYDELARTVFGADSAVRDETPAVKPNAPQQNGSCGGTNAEQLVRSALQHDLTRQVLVDFLVRDAVSDRTRADGDNRHEWRVSSALLRCTWNEMVRQAMLARGGGDDARDGAAFERLAVTGVPQRRQRPPAEHGADEVNSERTRTCNMCGVYANIFTHQLPRSASSSMSWRRVALVFGTDVFAALRFFVEFVLHVGSCSDCAQLRAPDSTAPVASVLLAVVRDVIALNARSATKKGPQPSSVSSSVLFVAKCIASTAIKPPQTRWLALVRRVLGGAVNLVVDFLPSDDSDFDDDASALFRFADAAGVTSAGSRPAVSFDDAAGTVMLRLDARRQQLEQLGAALCRHLCLLLRAHRHDLASNGLSENILQPLRSELRTGEAISGIAAGSGSQAESLFFGDGKSSTSSSATTAVLTSCAELSLLNGETGAAASDAATQDMQHARRLLSMLNELHGLLSSHSISQDASEVSALPESTLVAVRFTILLIPHLGFDEREVLSKSFAETGGATRHRERGQDSHEAEAPSMDILRRDALRLAVDAIAILVGGASDIARRTQRSTLANQIARIRSVFHSKIEPVASLSTLVDVLAQLKNSSAVAAAAAAAATMTSMTTTTQQQLSVEQILVSCAVMAADVAVMRAALQEDAVGGLDSDEVTRTPFLVSYGGRRFVALLFGSGGSSDANAGAGGAGMWLHSGGPYGADSGEENSNAAQHSSPSASAASFCSALLSSASRHPSEFPRVALHVVKWARAAIFAVGRARSAGAGGSGAASDAYGHSGDSHFVDRDVGQRQEVILRSLQHLLLSPASLPQLQSWTQLERRLYACAILKELLCPAASSISATDANDRGRLATSLRTTIQCFCGDALEAVGQFMLACLTKVRFFAGDEQHQQQAPIDSSSSASAPLPSSQQKCQLTAFVNSVCSELSSHWSSELVHSIRHATSR